MQNKYAWEPPVAYMGDTVSVLDHRGKPRIGIVRDVQTYYNDKAEAYHVYRVTYAGLKRGEWLGTSQIVRVIG